MGAGKTGHSWQGRWLRRSWPLHVHIAVLFSLLTLLLGAALIGFQVRQMQQMAMRTAQLQFSRISYRVDAELGRAITPIQAAIDMLAFRQSQHSMFELAHKPGNLGALRDALRQSPSLASLFVAADTGEHLVARLLPAGSQLAERAKAPAGADMLVLSVELKPATNEETPALWQRHMLFYSAELDLLEERIEAGEAGQGVRNQDWYRRAMDEGGQSVLTPMYVFPYSGEVGATFARRIPGSRVVVGADISLQKMDALLDQAGLSGASQIYLLDAQGRVLAGRGLAVPASPAEAPALLQQARHASPLLARLVAGIGLPAKAPLMLAEGGQRWLSQLSALQGPGGVPLYLALLAPKDELLREVGQTRQYAILIAALLLVIALPLVWWVARRVARPLEMLTEQVEEIRHFRFSENGKLHSRVREIDQLAASMNSLKGTIRRFMDIGEALGGERQFDKVLECILRETARLVGARSGLIYLASEHGATLGAPAALWGLNPPEQLPQACELDHPACRALHDGTVSCILEAAALQHLFGGMLAPRESGLGCVAIALRNRQGVAVGVLLLLMKEKACAQPDLLALIEALSGTAAVAIESQRLLEEQKRLMQSVVEMLADAIDAKSPYTGGHCRRVPVLTRMLAEAACASQEGPFSDFTMSPAEWEALHIASWLHDCGKVTTPEHVVDKATRLETIYDRIHEIRMRFEVIKREAEVACWQSIAGGLPRSESLTALHNMHAVLDAEFAFVAESNSGETLMTPERLERLERIAKRQWTRTLDDRLGLSYEALLRFTGPSPTLPVPEPLLADQPWHRIPRPPCQELPDIRLQPTKLLYDHGELHNLSVTRGTLTAEERYKINEHIVQTIAMLSRLELPAYLRAVPDIAGGHHERMDGHGFPRQLSGEQMSVQARMMAVADVFEALTAADRPYKPGKKLSEVMSLMDAMASNGHLDPQIWALFKEAGVWRSYAHEFISPEQVDV